MRTVAFLLTAAMISLATTASADIAWQSDLRAAHAQAEAQGKLLLLHFYSDNCVWCDRLEAGAFKSPEVGQAVSGRFVPVKIHGDKHQQLIEMFKVTKFPTDVIVTTEGQTLAHTVSPQKPTSYVGMLANALSAKSKMSAKTKPTVAAAAPASPPVTATPATEMQMPVQVPPANAAGMQTNQFADTKPLSGGASAQFASSRSGEMTLGLPTETATEPVTKTEPETAEAKQASAPESGDRPELAMQGFCPVTVIKEDRWVEGNPKFGVIHLGKLYLFSSSDAMESFLADPVPFTPVLNEIDVVRFFEERKIVQGKREWGLKDPTHNRMFFFADEAAMNHFWNEYERYTGAAIEVMEKAVQDANPGT